MKPILFNTKMVQAILKGNKTVTRRKIDWDIINNCDIDTDGTLLNYQNNDGDFINPVDLCRYKVGDVLWVRETWTTDKDFADVFEKPLTHGFYYKADAMEMEWVNDKEIVKWHPSIHMPKKAARLFLEVTNIKIERIQDIGIVGVMDEGIRATGAWDYVDYIEAFEELWNSTTKDHVNYGWDSDCFVWVIEFEKTESEGE